MKRKALLCVLLALTLLFTAQPAAALTSNQRATVIVAETRMPDINVTVPASVDVMINPLEMPVKVGSGELDEQIICSPAYIVSRSEVPLRVDVTITGSVYKDSDLQLVSSSAAVTGTAKKAFVYFEMQQTDAEYWEDVTWDPRYNETKHIAVRPSGPATRKGFVTLPALTLDRELAENAYAWFRLSGNAVKSPANKWTTDDGISVTVAFTFTPLPYSSN